MLAAAIAGCNRDSPDDCTHLPTAGLTRELALARCLADGEPLPVWRSGPPRQVHLYVDRSGSMRGFLDPNYPTEPTDYRSVIDALCNRLSPARVLGFGSRLTAADCSLGTLGNKGFYADNNTLLEQALDTVQADTGRTFTHVIVGDGRRVDPNAANAQYTRIRQVAERWIGSDGTFLVAASKAPFAPVPGDPAGCRSAGEASAGEPTRCPLYAFAFVAPGDAGRIAPVLAGVFERLFAWPLPAVPPTGLLLLAPQSGGEIALDHKWHTAADSSWVARSTASAASNDPLRARLVLADSTSPEGRMRAKLLTSHDYRSELEARSLAPGSAWQPVSAVASPVRPTASPLELDLISYGPAAPPNLYRIELRPTGTASWLPEFDAQDAQDAVRTYGLGRVFELFSGRLAGQAGAVGRVFVIAN